MTNFSDSMLIRVYYEDTDHGGVVYYANYLKFMGRARTEFLRAAGMELDTIDREFGVLFAVTEANVRFRAPARFNDLLIVESSMTHLRGARITFQQRILRQNSRKVLTEADIHLACMKRDGSVSRIPGPIASVLKQHI